MEKRRLVGSPPQFPCDELAVPGKELRRPRGLLHVERFSIPILRPGTDIVQLQIRVCGYVNDAIPVRNETRLRQLVAREVYGERRRVARSQVSRRVERIWLRVKPAAIGERQSGYVAMGAADAREPGIAESDGVFHFAIPGYYASRDWQCRLEDAYRRDVRARELVYEAVSIGVGSDPEP